MTPASPSLEVLNSLQDWLQAGLRAALVTVLETYGTSPRPAGSLSAICEDGRICGSVSGGCVEEILSRHVQARWQSDSIAGVTAVPVCEILRYGLDAEEQNRLRLPCGKQVHVSVEYQPNLAQLRQINQALDRRQSVHRSLRYSDGHVSIELLATKHHADALRCNPEGHLQVIGPRHRLILIGANDVASYIAPMAQALDFQVLVCEPRTAYRNTWKLVNTPIDARMPDDLIRDSHVDSYTAVLAVSHDPRLDDLALMEALTSDCFYVGVIGSRASAPKRRERLILLDVSPAQLARLHSPAGLSIGSRTPPQIAVSVLAELVAQQNAVQQAAVAAHPRRTDEAMASSKHPSDSPQAQH